MILIIQDAIIIIVDDILISQFGNVFFVAEVI